MKTALITGITGQDGAYLAQFLLSKDYQVYGTFRRLSTPNFWRLQALGVYDKTKLISMDLHDMSSMMEAISISNPDEIYHLAAQSFVGASFDQPLATADMSGIGTARMLEAIRISKKDAKFYQASTSELYGNSSPGIKSENSSFHPRSPYAAAKLYAYWIAKIYREGYGLFCSNGILFNHESPLRGLEFVTRKISNACAKISLGLQDNVAIGNLDTKRDWGFAGDYVKSMWQILQHDNPDDFVVATGESHSVKEFIDLAFERVNLDPAKYVKVDKHLLRPLEVKSLTGDSSKTQTLLGWKATVGFKELVWMMVDEDLRRWKSWKNGILFPWDAPLYSDQQNIIISRYSMDR
jgi:GDPmannose 4,6-dehydratase